MSSNGAFFNLDKPLLALATGEPGRSADLFTIRDATEGVQIFGAVGSGKTSGSGAALALSYLANGFGGLVCCAKPDERALWQEYCRMTNRDQDLVVFGSPDQPWRFDFLDYEARRTGLGGGSTENLVNLFSVVTEIVEGKQTPGGGDAFWPRAMQSMLRNTIDMLSMAYGTVSIGAIVNFITSAPQTPEQASSKIWRESEFCPKTIDIAEVQELTPLQRHDFEVAAQYWLQEWPRMNDRTRTSIAATFTSIADILNHGLSWQLMASGETTIVPENTYKNGAIILLDLPIQEYGEQGRILQGIWKYMFQRVILRRNAKVDPRPVFLWADESQQFLNSFDYQYQAVARSARSCTVYLTQNISNMYAVLGSNSKDQANALLGNFQTKILHANTDEATNQWASNMIAQTWRMTGNFSSGGGEHGQNVSAGASEGMHYKVKPEEFTRMRMGGPQNNNRVEAIIFKGGRVWNSSGDTYMRTSFVQQP